jgi:3-oxoacyl-(acyl-carrier-protein) synthase
MSSSKSSSIVGTTRDDIAIVGMACKFPCADTPQAFWDNLVQGRSSVREIDDSRWRVADHYSPDPLAGDRSVSKWAGLVDGIDRFDAAFFKISPREAALMDPQQRIMLELSWSCLEDAGYAPATLRGSSTAVYVGVCNYDYKEMLEKLVHPIEGHISTGTYTALIPNRISYEFDFRGTSVPVDTACSSSLVALHEAVHALRRGDCENALVGGISILCSPTYFIAFSKLGMLSPNGQCRTFDEGADGYVRGEGAGMLMLKSLGAALEHGDRIHAVIRGTGVNHGGKAPTLTSPNPYAQAKVIADTCERAGVSPDSIGYIEAHGTGTPKGDPIEIVGLKRAFATLERSFGVSVPSGACGLGSVKTNIGHLESASGIAGVIKTVLSLRHRMLPPLLNFEELNKRIDLKGSPFQIVDTLREWVPSAAGSPLRAGVSSFGFGGVNAHVVLDEYRQPIHAPQTLAPLPVVLSARTEERLRAHALALLTHLESQSQGDSALSRIARTLNGREAMEWRAVCTVRTTAELVDALRLLAQEPGRDRIETPELLRCHVASAVDELKSFVAKPDTADKLRSWIAARDIGNTAAWWVRGLSVDWSFVFAGTPGGLPSLIDLPSYPFLGRRHWIEQPESQAAATAPVREPSQVWMLDESWQAVAAADADDALEADTLLVTLVDDAAARCIRSRLAHRPVIELHAPANPGDGESWIDAYVRNIDAIKAGIKKQPRRLLLLSNTHHDVASFLFPAIQSVQKEFQLPARWFSWESGFAADKAVPLALRQACSGPWSAGRFRLREFAGEPSCEQLQWSCARRHGDRERSIGSRGCRTGHVLACHGGEGTSDLPSRRLHARGRDAGTEPLDHADARWAQRGDPRRRRRSRSQRVLQAACRDRLGDVAQGGGRTAAGRRHAALRSRPVHHVLVGNRCLRQPGAERLRSGQRISFFLRRATAAACSGWRASRPDPGRALAVLGCRGDAAGRALDPFSRAIAGHRAAG